MLSLGSLINVIKLEVRWASKSCWPAQAWSSMTQSREITDSLGMKLLRWKGRVIKSQTECGGV